MSTLDRPGRIAAVVGSVALAAFLFVSLVNGTPATSSTGSMGTSGGMGIGGGMGMGGGMWLAAAPLILLLLVAALAFGYAGVRILGSETDDATDTGDAADADPIARLKRQYAAGDLTEAAFERAVERELEAQEESDRRVAASADAERVRSTQR